MKFGLDQTHIDAMNRIFSQYPAIDRVLIYGSRAKGSYKKGSDIDLTIEGNGFTYSDLLGIENKIDDLLLPWKTDLSLLHQIANPDLIEHIHRIGVVFYEKM